VKTLVKVALKKPSTQKAANAAKLSKQIPGDSSQI